MEKKATPHRIVIVGGGAGGLELATQLGRKLGKSGNAQITLVDREFTHIWKPLFHEVAAGTLYSSEDTLDYLAQAKRRYFRFHYGSMTALDRGNQQIRLAAVRDDADKELAPERIVAYDTLVLAVGSVSNTFNTPGADQHCMYLDSTAEAERFQRSMANAYFRAQAQETPLTEGQLSVAIVGAGATGVELAAELRNAARRAKYYALEGIDPETDLRLTIVEAAERVLPALSPGLSARTHEQLEALGVRVLVGSKVVEATEHGLQLADGEFIAADMKLWSAGVKAPDWLHELDGLETTKNNQLIVSDSLQTTRDPNVFALGDCAASPAAEGSGILPPRAQVASQQAAFLVKALKRRLEGESPGAFVYKDRGSLIALEEGHAVGQLMGSTFGRFMIEGLFARAAYASLYTKHLATLHGMPSVIMTTIVHALTRHHRPKLKLH